MPIRIDPHVKVLDEATVERAARAGFDAIVYAPHFTRLPAIEREAERLSTDDLLVIPGREVFTGSYGNRKHVLAFGLEEPVPDFVSLDAAMVEFERQDATVLAPHPEFFTVGLEAADLREYRDVIDAVEVHNPKHWPGHTRRAHELVDELGLPAYGSSYAHLRGTVGDVWTEFDVESAAHRAANGGRGVEASTEATASAADGGDLPTSIDDVADASALLRSGTGRVRRRTGVAAAGRASAEFLHLSWENSWKKTDRVLLSGREPTHPDDPAYGGRFDDAAVY